MLTDEVSVSAKFNSACALLVFEQDRQQSYFAIDAENSLTVDELYRRIQNKHPKAGRGYWAVNLWRQLTWQPIYMALVSVCYRLPMPDLRKLKQCVDDTVVYKFCEPKSWQMAKQSSDLLEVSEALTQVLSEMHALLESACRLQKHKAQAQVQDLLAVGLKRINPEADAKTLQPELSRWQQAMAMSSLNYFTGATPPQLVRADCCMHIKVAPEAPCSNCPKVTKRVQKEN